jgi:uncharacterized membrane protein YbhN (UPF0104 family)
MPPEAMPFWQRLRSHAHWRWAVRIASLALLLLIAALLYRQGRNMDWPGVWRAVRALPPPVLLAAGGLALASHLLYGCFDLIGRHYHRLPIRVASTVGITLVSYPFTLNLGSLIGGVAVRLRLYSRQGLAPLQIGQIAATSVLSNWIGYFPLAGAALWLWPPKLSTDWLPVTPPWRAIALVLAAVPLAYWLLCAWRHGRPLAWRGHRFVLAGPWFAPLQVAMSALNWALMSGAVWTLLQQQVPYAAVLSTMLFGAVAGLVSRVPAGLGVLEAVAVALLAGMAPAEQVLAAVLAYRALYYFGPLLLAVLGFGLVEWRARRRQR